MSSLTPSSSMSSVVDDQSATSFVLPISASLPLFIPLKFMSHNNTNASSPSNDDASSTVPAASSSSTTVDDEYQPTSSTRHQHHNNGNESIADGLVARIRAVSAAVRDDEDGEGYVTLGDEREYAKKEISRRQSHDNNNSIVRDEENASMIYPIIISSSPIDIALSSPTTSSALITDPSSSPQPIEYVSYPKRWLVLLVFSLMSMSNAIMWICFAPIQQRVANYYSVSNLAINTLSIVFMVLYLPGYILSFWCLQRFGLRNSFLAASVLQSVGSWLRYASTIGEKNNHANYVFAFGVLMMGQCAAAMAQPMFTNTPARLSGDWFSSSQRNLGTTIGAMVNPIGIAVGQLIPTLMVDDNGGISMLILTTAVISTFTTILCYLYIESAPPTPPSRSTHDRIIARNHQAHALSLLPANDPAHSFWHSALIEDLKVLTKNYSFMLLFFSVGIGLGLFNTVSTLIAQLVAPVGYSSDDAGNFGALLIGIGLPAAGIVGAIMDATHEYNKIFKTGMVTALAATIFMLLALRPGEYAMLCISFGVLGGAMLPLLPVCMECAAECTYPVSEDASTGLLLLAGNLVGVIMIFALGDLIPSTYTTVVNPASIFIVVFIGLAVVVGFAYNGDMKRQQAESESLLTFADDLPSVTSESSDTHKGEEA